MSAAMHDLTFQVRATSSIEESIESKRRASNNESNGQIEGLEDVLKILKFIESWKSSTKSS